MKTALILLVGMLGTTPTVLKSAEKEQCPFRECAQRQSYQGRFIEHYFSHFPNQLITCPFCRTYQAKDLKKLALHSFSLECKGEKDREQWVFDSFAFTNCPICDDEVSYFDFFNHITNTHPPRDRDLATDRADALSIAPPEHPPCSSHDNIPPLKDFYHPSEIVAGNGAEDYLPDFDDFSTLFAPPSIQPENDTFQLEDILSPNTIAFLNLEQAPTFQEGAAALFDDFSELFDPLFPPKQLTPNEASDSGSVPLASKGNARGPKKLCFKQMKVPLLCGIEGCPYATTSKIHTRRALQKHYQNKHPKEKKINYSIFFCIVCNTTHHSRKAFIHHMETHTVEDFMKANGLKPLPMLPTQNQEDIETYLQTKGIIFQCPKRGCHISLPTLTELTEHCRHLHKLPISLEKERYHCSRCNLTIHEPKELYEHIHYNHPYEKKPSTFVKAIFSINQESLDDSHSAHDES